MVSLAEPILRKHKMKLAVENHKGWRAAEQAEWIKRVGSEYIGVCFDFGNNLALCEDPMETFRLLEPLTIYCHMKDMGVDQYEDGFLLSEVVFGEGIVDLRNIVNALQRRDPNMVFAIEMITRDPLKIPVYKESYWPTFADPSSPLPGRDLARVLDLVRKNPPKSPLPRIADLTPEAKVKAEDDYNLKCIEYSRQQLRF
jgi:sugar phosphate isomerase/epimerase